MGMRRSLHILVNTSFALRFKVYSFMVPRYYSLLISNCQFPSKWYILPCTQQYFLVGLILILLGRLMNSPPCEPRVLCVMQSNTYFNLFLSFHQCCKPSLVGSYQFCSWVQSQSFCEFPWYHSVGASYIFLSLSISFFVLVVPNYDCSDFLIA